MGMATKSKVFKYGSLQKTALKAVSGTLKEDEQVHVSEQFGLWDANDDGEVGTTGGLKNFLAGRIKANERLVKTAACKKWVKASRGIVIACDQSWYMIHDSMAAYDSHVFATLSGDSNLGSSGVAW